MWNMAQPETVAALEAAASALGKAGAEIRDIEIAHSVYIAGGAALIYGAVLGIWIF